MNTKDNKSDNLWADKPWWCQPWSVILTGIILISLSFLWPGNIWVTIFISILIILWWYIFLIFAPTVYTNEQLK